ncbi:MFS general substrate transporter [Xylariaceae sp. AK1471]|nr:MFS general substrate transporter [Xylariaceae sp. AK1471]
MTNAEHGTGDVSESTALLRGTPVDNNRDVSDQSVSSKTQHIAQHRRKWRVILLLYTLVFIMMLGDNLYPAALIQVLEDIICTDNYGTSSEAVALYRLPESDSRCKAQAVQKELALVRGFQQLMPVFAGVLCTVPYSLLADRIGRKRVLMLSCAGTAFAFAWVLAVCYFRFVPVRWIWLSGAFLFIGGGDPVLSSVAHVMITDTTERPERAQIFLCLHAADVLSGFFGPAISAALMENGRVWTVLLLSGAASFFGAFVIASLLPETLHLSQSATTSSSILTQESGSASEDPVEPAKPHSSLLAPLRAVLASNPQALLLLCIFAPQTAARELFNSIGLQYSSVKFNLSYSRGNVLLSLFQGAQGLLALVLLPFITRVLAVPRGWSAWTRDRLYTIVSISATTSGLLVIALAPTLSIEIIGLLLVSLGSCTNGLLMGLMGGTVRPNQVSAIYSAALMLSIMVRSGTGPVFSALFMAGLELGWKWLGLPFAVMAALMVCELGASSFIRTERVENVEDEQRVFPCGDITDVNVQNS